MSMKTELNAETDATNSPNKMATTMLKAESDDELILYTSHITTVAFFVVCVKLSA